MSKWMSEEFVCEFVLANALAARTRNTTHTNTQGGGSLERTAQQRQGARAHTHTYTKGAPTKLLLCYLKPGECFGRCSRRGSALKIDKPREQRTDREAEKTRGKARGGREKRRRRAFGRVMKHYFRAPATNLATCISVVFIG